jgi:hypothetical protein
VTFHERRAQADRLRAIPLAAVLPLCGAEPDRHDPSKWHTPAGVVSVAGAKFMNWNRGRGGGGAIDLVIYLHDLGFKDAVDWLGQHFGGQLPPSLPVPAPPARLSLPPRVPAMLGRVQRYLATRRGIAPELVDSLIRSGTLYADARANAVFLLSGNDGAPVGAELRGTTEQSWRGLAPGSRKDLGFFSIPADPLPAVVLCESAIDAISCFALAPGRRCISTAGARPNPPWLGELIAQTSEVFCGFDADATGDHLASEMITFHPSVKRLRPTHHDWNDVLRSPP